MGHIGDKLAPGLLGAALLTYVFVAGLADTPLAYAAYTLSFYALVLACACIPRLIRLSERARENEHVSRFLSDYAFRTYATLGLGLLLNLGFAAFKLAAGAVYRSYWLVALGFYYAVLALMRFFLLRRLGGLRPCAPNLLAQYRTYRLTGALMLALNLVMSTIILQVVRDNQTYSYPGTIIYAFGADEPQFRLIANAASGAAICLGILLIAVTMVHRGTRAIRSLSIHNS